MSNAERMKAKKGKEGKKNTTPEGVATADLYSKSGRSSAIGASAVNKKTLSLGSAVQTKVTVGQAGDRYEREADGVADKVTSGRAAGDISRIPSGGLKAQTQLVQRDAEDGDGAAQMEDDQAQEKCASCDSEDAAQKKPEEKAVETAQAKDAEPEGEVQEECAACDDDNSVQKSQSESVGGTQTLQRKGAPESVTPENNQTQMVQREPEDSDASEEGDDDDAQVDAGPVGGEDDPDAADCGGGEVSDTESSAGETESEEEGEGPVELADAASETESDESPGGGEEVGCGQEGGEEQEPEGGPSTDPHAEQSCGVGSGESSAEQGEGEGLQGEEGSEDSAESEPPIRPQQAPGCADEVAEHEDTAAEIAPEAKESEGESPAAESGGECAVQTKHEAGAAQMDSEDSAQEMAVQRDEEESAQESDGDGDAQMDGEGGVSDCAPAEAEAEAQMKAGPDPAARTNKSEIAARAIGNRDAGEPLTPSVRGKLEQSLRMNLSSVRVHTGTKAEEANRGLRAKAFTHKNHIWLGAGRNQSDIKLMAHEVAHTVQQGAVTQAKGGPVQPHKDEERSEANGAGDSEAAQMEADQPEERVQASPMPTQRENEFRWDPRHYERVLEISSLIDQLLEEEHQDDNAKKREIIRQIEAQVESMWRDFKTYVDSKGGFAGLTGEEKAYLDDEEKKISETEKSLTPASSVAEKDKRANALRRKALQSMGPLLKDPYAVYWMFVSQTVVLWKGLKDESVPLDLEKFSAAVDIIGSAKSFVKDDFRRLIYSVIAKHYNMTIEDVWFIIEPEKDDSAGGSTDASDANVKEGEKAQSLKGDLSEKRIQKLTKKQKKLLKRLPKNMQKSQDQDALVNLLDHLLTLPKGEQDELINNMHDKEKQRAKSDKQAGDKDKNRESSDQKIDVDELKAEEKVKDAADEILKDKIEDEPQRENEKNDLAEFLKTLPEDERRAFLAFLESVKSDAQHADKKSAKEIHDAYSQLSDTDKEALKVKKLLNEQNVDESQKLADADQKAIRAMVKQHQAEAEQTQASLSKMNEDMAFIASLVSDPDAKKAMVAFDPEDFRIMPEMMMLMGMMDGASRMSPELKEAADGLKNQIGQIRGKVISEIKWIAAELALHAGLGAVPVVGWLKTAASAVRLISLGRRLNRLRETLTALKRGYDTFNRLSSAIEQARGVVKGAPGFVKKFEQARENWEQLQAQLDSADSSEDIEERLELAFEQLMEQMDERLEALEPFLEKLYLPEDVRDDSQALVRVLFNIPKGIDSFGDMLGSYEKLGNTNEPRELELLYYKGAQTGALMYPLVGFVIGSMSESLGAWLGRDKGLDRFLEKRKKWKSKGGKSKSAAGNKLSALWSRKLEFKGHRKGHTPQFDEPLKKGAEYLDKQIPKTDVPWQYRIKTFLRFKLRQIVKYLNRLNIKVQGRRKAKRKQAPEPWGQVPLPPFKYKLKRSGKYHNVTLRINPEYERKIEAIDYSVFKGKGIALPDFKTDEGQALKKWLGDNGYELTHLRKIGWHIRRSQGHAVTKQPLRIDAGRITQGLESKDSKALDQFVQVGNVIGGNEQLPDGFHLQVRGPGLSRTSAEQYIVKKHPHTAPAYPLHLDEKAKLAKGTASGKAALVLDSTVPADPTKDVQGRPHEVKNQRIGYTVNRPRSALPKNVLGLRKNDDRGHLIAHRFNGSSTLGNLVAMNRKFNQSGAWYKEEAALAKAFKGAWQAAAAVGQKVAAFLSVSVSYLGTKTRRPDSFKMSWEVKKDDKKYDDGSIKDGQNK